MLGLIGFDGLKVRCVIGVDPEERIQEQEIFIDLRTKVNISGCALTDDIQKTVNYALLANACSELAQKKCCCLIETLAYAIVTHLIEEWKLPWVWVKIRKPSALLKADCAVVEFEKYQVEQSNEMDLGDRGSKKAWC